MNRVNPGTIRTAVLDGTRGTPIRADALHGRIVDVVAIAIARVAFERVQQTQPMARLVDRRLPLVEPDVRAVRHRKRVDVATVREIVSQTRDIDRQRADAEVVAVQVCLEVEVEILIRPVPQRRLHVYVILAGADRPFVIDGIGGGFEIELKTGRLVSFVERRKLGVHHVLRDVSD